MKKFTQPLRQWRSPMGGLVLLSFLIALVSPTTRLHAQCTVNAGPDQTICAGASVQLNAVSSGTTSYSWSPVAGLSNPNILNPIASPTNTTTYTLTASTGSGSVDQSQTSNTTCMANFSQTGLAQSFIPSLNVICGARIFITSGSGTGDITIQLYNNLPNQGGVMMAQGTVTGIGTSQWAQVSWSSVSVTPGTTYYLVFTSTNGNLCVAGNTSNPYPNGQVYANSGFGAFPTFDYTFETFGCGGACSVSDQVVVTVNPSPTVNAGADVGICSGSNVTLNGSVSGASSFSWTPPAGLSNPNILNPIASPSGTTTYTLTATTAGCTATDAVIVTVTPTPVVNAGPDQVICIGGSVTLNGSGTASSYSWAPPAGLSNANVLNPVASPTTTTTYILTGSNGGSGPDQSQLSNTTCMANFSQTGLAQSFIPSVGSICGARIFITSGSGTGDITIQLYNFLPNASGVVLAQGTVTGIGTSQWAQVNWPSVPVTPGTTYYLVFTSTNGNLCVAGNTSNPYPNGQVYANSGFGPFPTFDYTFETFACGGSCGVTDTVVVTVGPGTLANAGPDQTLCGTTTTLAGNPPSPGSGVWSIVSGAGGSIAAPNSPTSGFTGLAGNSYTLRWSITNPSCGTNFDDVLISADGQAPTALCHSITVTLGANGTGSTTAAAVDNGSSDNCAITTMTLNTSNFTCNNIGSNNVVLTVSDANGNTATCSANVTVAAAPLGASAFATLTNCGYNLSCNGSSDGIATVNASGGCPNYTYLWDNGAITATVNNLSAGVHTVTVTDAHGGTNVNTVILTEPSPISVNLGNISGSCTGASTGSVDITPIGGNSCAPGYTFLWSTGATTQNLANVPGGVYTVTVTDPMGCTGTQTATVPVTAGPTPTISSAGNVLTSNQSWVTYQWLLNGVPIPGATSANYTGTVTGDYTLVVTDANGCSGTSSPIHLEIVGVQDQMNWPVLSIHPNPARNSFQLTTAAPIGFAFTVTIHDVFGRKLFVQEFEGMAHSAQFDVKHLSAGNYLVEVMSLEGQRKVLRLIVQ